MTGIDHITATVGWNEMRRWADFYTDVLGFSPQTPSDLGHQESSRLSTTVTHEEGGIAFPIHEPARTPHDGKSPIEQYLESYHGPGVQRIGLATANILETVDRMRRQGVDFLCIPPSYYAQLRKSSVEIDEPIDLLERLGILVHRDDSGYLLQAVTRPVEDRPTLCFEIVQRKGCRSYTANNWSPLAETAR